MEVKIVVRIGKKGITNELVAELDSVLKKHGMVKVKLLKNFREIHGIDREKVAQILAEKLKAKIIEIRGFTITLKRTKTKIHEKRK